MGRTSRLKCTSSSGRRRRTWAATSSTQIRPSPSPQSRADSEPNRLGPPSILLRHVAHIILLIACWQVVFWPPAPATCERAKARGAGVTGERARQRELNDVAGTRGRKIPLWTAPWRGRTRQLREPEWLRCLLFLECRGHAYTENG